MEKKPKSNKQFLLEYVGLSFQMLSMIGLALYGGYYFDKWIKTGFPLFIWLLPLIVIIGMIVKVIKDTSKK